MVISNKKEPFLLLLGDLFIFAISLWLSLAIRNGEFPTGSSFMDNLVPFSILFLAWVTVFFIAGLYEKHTSILKEKIPLRLLNAQIINTLVAIIFFYFIPYFGVAPKTILFIDLILSFLFVYSWRSLSNHIFGLKSKESAIIIGSGDEVSILEKEINSNGRYGLKLVSNIDPSKYDSTKILDEIRQKVSSENVSVIIMDLKDEKVVPTLSQLYSLIFSGVNFVDINEVYESIFNREPLSLVKYNWFLENISQRPRVFYDFVKRFVDIIFSFVVGVVFLVFLPFVALAIKIEDGGSVFYRQERIGKNNKTIKILKFRSMSQKEKEKITKVGLILRKTRIDELPQFWNLLSGDVSLIGPRPESPTLAKEYEREIPYYNIRHIIKPGLSGWAQIYQENPPKYGVDFSNTKDKLSYDLYYVKNRSLAMDFSVGLKTFKELISTKGK